jgi:hypothetical protein
VYELHRPLYHINVLFILCWIHSSISTIGIMLLMPMFSEILTLIGIMLLMMMSSEILTLIVNANDTERGRRMVNNISTTTRTVYS